jgi:seryl-tRNA synthetase
MLDIKFIRENKDLVKDAARKKHIECDVDALIAVDDKRKAIMTSIEEKKAKQNAMGEMIVRSTDEQEKKALIQDMKALKGAKELEEESLKEIMREWQMRMVGVPNLPDISVPEGATDEENQTIRKWGMIYEIPNAKSHIDLMLQHEMVDFERGTKVSGFRGYFLKNDGFRLNFALWQYVFNYFNNEGFTPMLVPSLVRRETLIGSGYLPQGEEDLYKTQDGDYLAGTGEVATMAYYSDEIIEKSKLPMKIIAFSPCFRREAGSHGKDTKGLMRVHEFFKFEQIILCEADHQQTVNFHEEILGHSEKIMQSLNLPYQVVVVCGGDLGLGQVKKYDIEAWVPSEGRYRETHSASYFHDFQTRRLNIRYRDDDGKLKFAHSLNNTALPTPRPLISLIENNQQPDGSIKIPEVLIPYMGKDIIS